MNCPNCNAPHLDLTRAQANTRAYHGARHKVAAPCCGAPLSVVIRVRYETEVTVNESPTDDHDDWGVKYKKVKKEI